MQDDYPVNKFLIKTNFSAYQEVILDSVGKVQQPPKWMVYDNGREIVQTANGYANFIILYIDLSYLHSRISIISAFVELKFACGSSQELYCVAS